MMQSKIYTHRRVIKLKKEAVAFAVCRICCSVFFSDIKKGLCLEVSHIQGRAAVFDVDFIITITITIYTENESINR